MIEDYRVIRIDGLFSGNADVVQYVMPTIWDFFATC